MIAFCYFCDAALLAFCVLRLVSEQGANIISFIAAHMPLAVDVFMSSHS
jgi:hypothetical protein